MALLHFDITIDTNVLVHAGDPESKFQAESVALAEEMIESVTLLCVDEGYTSDPSTNRSYVGYEYERHLHAGSLGSELVAMLARSGRIIVLPKNSRERALNKKVVQMIRKPRDRVFLGLACNSESKILVSHDFEDFQKPKRTSIRKDLAVRVLTAGEVLGAK